MKDRFQTWWRTRSPDHRRVIVLVGTLGILVGVLYLVVVRDGGKPSAFTAQARTVSNNILTGADPKAIGLDGLAARQDKLEQANRDMQKDLANLRGELQRDAEQDGVRFDRLQKLMEQVLQDTRARISDATRQAREIAIQQDARTRDALQQFGQQEQGRGAIDGRLPAAPPVIPVNGVDSGTPWTRKPKYQDGEVAEAFTAPSMLSSAAPTVGAAPPGGQAAVTPIKGRVYGETVRNVDSTVDEEIVYIPAGSILTGVLITGVDAPTSFGAKRDPVPTLFRIKREAILPNRYRADIRECFIVLAAAGDLSSERAYMRGETLSCVRDDGGVIEVAVDSYAAGEDGKAGVRGRLVTREGAIIARSLAAGFLAGVADIFRPIAVQGIQTRPDSDTLFQTPPVAEAMQSGALGGASSAMNRLADYYVKLAEQKVPVIEVDAGRTIEVIVKGGVSLKVRS